MELLGELIIADGSRILASVCGGDLAPLRQLVEREDVHHYVRGEAIETMAVLAAWGEKSKDEVVAYYRELFQAKLAQPGDRKVWTALVVCSCYLGAGELLPEIRQAFESDLIDTAVTTLVDVEDAISQRKDELFKQFANSQPPMNDTVREFERWTAFCEREVSVESRVAKALRAPPRPAPYVAPQKIGRNDTCPCGSGKKYKKCCGATK